jgi:hypothetical protein
MILSTECVCFGVDTCTLGVSCYLWIFSVHHWGKVGYLHELYRQFGAVSGFSMRKQVSISHYSWCLSTCLDLRYWSHPMFCNERKEYSCRYYRIRIKRPIISYLSDRLRVRGDHAPYAEYCSDSIRIRPLEAIGVHRCRID